MSEVEELRATIVKMEAQMKIDRKYSNGHLTEKINSRDEKKNLRAEVKVAKKRIEDLELIVKDSMNKFHKVDQLVSGILFGSGDRTTVMKFMERELIGLMISRCKEGLKNGQ